MSVTPTTTRQPLRARRIARAACALLLILSACSNDSVSQTERAVAPTPIAAPDGIGPAGQALTLEVIDGGPATGLVITDHRGFAVYGVTGEEANGQPTCVEACLDVWIPLSPRDLAISDRLDMSLFEVYTRPDGVDQVVYAQIPLYLWSGDSEVGVTGGAGVAGTWFALTETAGFVN